MWVDVFPALLARNFVLLSVCLIDESDDDGVHNTGADLSLVKY